MAYEEGNNTVMPVMPMGANNGFGNFGGDGWWILILFFLLAGNNGWGNNMGGMNNLYPWMNNSQNINDGFRDQFMNTQLSALQTNLNGVQSTLMQQSFNMQSEFQNCCCENRLATAQTQSIVQQEGAATRAAIQAQTQAILDKMCQQEIDALKAQNAELQTRINMQALAASQTAQTAALVADNTMQTQYIVNRVAPYPIPAYIVANPATPTASNS